MMREEEVDAYLLARVGDVVCFNIHDSRGLREEWREVTRVNRHHVTRTATVEANGAAIYRAVSVRRLTAVAADQWKEQR